MKGRHRIREHLQEWDKLLGALANIAHDDPTVL